MLAQWQQPAKKWKLRHKGADARSTKKSHQNQYNFKNHLNTDKVSNAAVHDSQMFETLLDQTEDKEGNKRPTSGDRTLWPQEKEDRLATDKVNSRICAKGAGNHPQTEEQKASKKEKSRVHVRIKHVFGAQTRWEVTSC